MKDERGEMSILDDMATRLEIGKRTVCRSVADGTIPKSNVGKAWRFPREDVDPWIKPRRNEDVCGKEHCGNE